MESRHDAIDWLWTEIARRFGASHAAELMMEYELRRSANVPSAGFDGEELPLLEARLQTLEEAGEPETAYMRSLRWRVNLHRQLAQDALRRSV